MTILVACECNGKIRDAFRLRGHEAFSCDLKDDINKSPYHMKCDVRTLLDQSWNMIIAHPPCTYLCKSGLRWFYGSDGLKMLSDFRMEKMYEGAEFFKLFRNLSHVPKVAIENPVLHHFAHKIIGEPTQRLQPWQFGNPECKETWLWLKGLPALKSTNIVPRHLRQKSTHKVKKGDNRSITFDEIAQAMANQWG